MSSEERGQWVYLVAIVLTYGAYVAIVLGRVAQTPVADVDYIPVMLGAIGLGIALSIVGRIVVEIAGQIREPSGRHETDVRDRDIGRFGEYFAGTILGIGMVVRSGSTYEEHRRTAAAIDDRRIASRSSVLHDRSDTRREASGSVRSLRDRVRWCRDRPILLLKLPVRHCRLQPCLLPIPRRLEGATDVVLPPSASVLGHTGARLGARPSDHAVDELEGRLG